MHRQAREGANRTRTPCITAAAARHDTAACLSCCLLAHLASWPLQLARHPNGMPITAPTAARQQHIYI